MKFLVVTHVVHKKHQGRLYAYGPYIKEMNLWLKHTDDFILVAPVTETQPSPIDLPYDKMPEILKVPRFSLITPKEILKTSVRLPYIIHKIVRGMRKADHIHLRLPGNMGLLGSIVQIFFPAKPKTVKYAGNWDPESTQPWSYKLQQRIVASPRLTKNAKVLAYGKWDNQPVHVLSFFTASYSENEIYEIPDKTLQEPVRLLFVGTLLEGKRPLLAAQTVKKLKERGIQARLEYYGDGPERKNIESFIERNSLGEYIKLLGKRPAEEVKKAYQNAHFLIFPSRSEGWPKVVAEAMVWKCLPVTTRISAVPYMLDEGRRGSLVNPDPDEIADEIAYHLQNPEIYQEKNRNAHRWSREFTLEKFEEEIAKLLMES